MVIVVEASIAAGVIKSALSSCSSSAWILTILHGKSQKIRFERFFFGGVGGVNFGKRQNIAVYMFFTQHFTQLAYVNVQKNFICNESIETLLFCCLLTLTIREHKWWTCLGNKRHAVTDPSRLSSSSNHFPGFGLGIAASAVGPRPSSPHPLTNNLTRSSSPRSSLAFPPDAQPLSIGSSGGIVAAPHLATLQRKLASAACAPDLVF